MATRRVAGGSEGIPMATLQTPHLPGFLKIPVKCLVFEEGGDNRYHVTGTSIPLYRMISYMYHRFSYTGYHFSLTVGINVNRRAERRIRVETLSLFAKVLPLYECSCFECVRV